MKILLLFFLTLIPFTSAYALYNDTLEITKPAIQEDTIQVNIQLNDYSSDHRINLVNSTITTKEFLVIDDNFFHKGPKGNNSTYYLGWNEALISINKTNIPDMQFNSTLVNGGDIVIELVNYAHPSKYSGSTEKYFNRSLITVYQIELLSDNQIQAVLRHEIGHALGLGHTSAPEDLMYEEVNQYYPFISPCSMQGIEQLYSGIINQEVKCLK